MRAKYGCTFRPPRSLRDFMATLHFEAWPSRRVTEHRSLHRLQRQSRQLCLCQAALGRRVSPGHGGPVGSDVFLFVPSGRLLLSDSSRYSGDAAASLTERMWPSLERSMVRSSASSSFGSPPPSLVQLSILPRTSSSPLGLAPAAPPGFALLPPLGLPPAAPPGFALLPPLGLPPAAPLGFALLLLSARTGIYEAHIAACQACPPVSPGSVFSHDNVYRWGDRGDSRTQSDLVTLGMIYPPSTAMRFQRISPSDRPSSESLAPQLPSPLTRGRTAPAHPTSPTHLHHETRA